MFIIVLPIIMLCKPLLISNHTSHLWQEFCATSAFIHSSFSNNGRSHAEGPSVVFVYLQTQY